jgi:hypothetical protein
MEKALGSHKQWVVCKVSFTYTNLTQGSLGRINALVLDRHFHLCKENKGDTRDACARRVLRGKDAQKCRAHKKYTLPPFWAFYLHTLHNVSKKAIRTH